MTKKIDRVHIKKFVCCIPMCMTQFRSISIPTYNVIVLHINIIQRDPKKLSNNKYIFQNDFWMNQKTYWCLLHVYIIIIL